MKKLVRDFRLIGCSLLLLSSVPALCEVSLTVYNQDLALVKDVRELDVARGMQKLAVNDVAARIDPSSVRFKLLSAPERYSLREQNFEYDLVSREKLLEKYIGKEITLQKEAKDGRKETVQGTLLSTQGGMVVQSGDRILLSPEGEVSLEKLPEGLVLKPTLSLLLDSQVSGRQKAEIDYLTAGMSWTADYVAVASKDDKSLDLTGWVTIDNRSGASFTDAQLKLVAGDVNRVTPPGMGMMDEFSTMRVMKAAAPQFQEKSFFEYHLYTLQRKTTLRDNETKQIELLSAASIPLKKIYTYDGAAQFRHGFAYQQWSRADRTFGLQQNTKVSVMLQFKNTKDNHLGMPLPKGKIRVYKEDSDKSLEFIGEDSIDHTPKDETVEAYLGDAFDIVGERVQTNFICGDDWCEESFKITVRNHKDEPVDITAVEHLYRWSNWKVTAKSTAFEKKDSRTIEFPLQVPANGSVSATYTVRYWW